MKQDSLEKFIRDNREDFDRMYPSAAVWDRIADELDKKEYRHQPRIYTLMKWAAAVTVILAVGFTLGLYTIKPQTERQQMMVNMGPQQYERYQEIQNYYTHQVSQKWDEVESLKAQLPTTDPGKLDDDLGQLDAVFTELKNELIKSHGADDEKIIDAMIMNYQTKIDILERVAEKLKQQQQSQQQQKDETVDI